MLIIWEFNVFVPTDLTWIQVLTETMCDSPSLHIEVSDNILRGLDSTMLADRSFCQIPNAEYHQFDSRSGRLRSYTYKSLIMSLMPY